MALMTVGQHDSAWLDVMTKRVPIASESLRCCATYLEAYTQLEIIKELGSRGLYDTPEEYDKDLLTLAEKAGIHLTK